MTRSFRQRGWIALLVLVGTLILAVYVVSRPQLALGQKPITDIQSIDTLRAQFNRDAGQTRLILLVSPT